MTHQAHPTLTPRLCAADAIRHASMLQAAAREDGQRKLVLLEGSFDGTYRTALAIAEALRDQSLIPQARWIGRGPAGQVLPITQARALLGGEHDLLIVCAFSGLDPDGLAAAVGTLRGGGLLFLLAPLLSEWPAWSDPSAARIATHPYRVSDVGRRFITRAARLLCNGPAVVRLGDAPGTINSAQGAEQILCFQHATHQSSCDRSDRVLTQEQQRALAAIRQLADGSAPGVLVLTAARGRGKSTTLGLAAAALLRERPRRVLVTAPNVGAARMLLEQALGERGGEARAIRSDVRRPHFRPPDQLAAETSAADLVLIDEAAGIPAPLLQRLIEQYPRVVLATTIHGYEGTGRGFTLRFFDSLDQLRPGWQHVELTQAFRWAPADPLDALINQLLLLDASPANAAEVIATAAQPVELGECDRDQLSRDDHLLRQVFGLLMAAHYQTRPSDLRHLLDGPNLSVHVLKRGNIVLATAVVADEGGFDHELAQAVFAGHRRPRGHLLPQTLSAHAGLAEAPRLKFSRIVRIAVHPAARRQGLARKLLDELARKAASRGQDLLGASFGLRPDLLEFWGACGFVSAHLGSSRNAASAAHAAVVLRPISPSGAALFAQACERFRTRFPCLLPGRLSQLEPAAVLALLQTSGEGVQDQARVVSLPFDKVAELRSFAHHQRGLEAALPILAQLAPEPLVDAIKTNRLSRQAAQAFAVIVLQQHRPEARAKTLGYPGKADLIRSLRRTTAILLGLVDAYST